jgi:hypothetical protein
MKKYKYYKLCVPMSAVEDGMIHKMAAAHRISMSELMRRSFWEYVERAYPEQYPDLANQRKHEMIQRLLGE